MQAASGAAGGYGGGGATGYANGGIVNGRPGLDRIPAMLTAGEFVIRESAVNQLGVQFLNALNERANVPQRSGDSRQLIDRDEARLSTSHNTNFGGVNIHVRQTTDLSELMRDLQAGGVRLRNRRG